MLSDIDPARPSHSDSGALDRVDRDDKNNTAAHSKHHAASHEQDPIIPPARASLPVLDAFDVNVSHRELSSDTHKALNLLAFVWVVFGHFRYLPAVVTALCNKYDAESLKDWIQLHSPLFLSYPATPTNLSAYLQWRPHITPFYHHMLTQPRFRSQVVRLPETPCPAPLEDPFPLAKYVSGEKVWLGGRL